jgi:hypothetical protein
MVGGSAAFCIDEEMLKYSQNMNIMNRMSKARFHQGGEVGLKRGSCASWMCSRVYLGRLGDCSSSWSSLGRGWYGAYDMAAESKDYVRVII